MILPADVGMDVMARKTFSTAQRTRLIRPPRVASATYRKRSFFTRIFPQTFHVSFQEHLERRKRHWLAFLTRLSLKIQLESEA